MSIVELADASNEVSVGGASSEVMDLHRRDVSDEEWSRFERTMAEIFTAFGMNLETPATREPRTVPEGAVRGDRRLRRRPQAADRVPDRVPLRRRLPRQPDHRGPIPFYSLCEHHSLPFHGFAHVGYVSHERIIGISKLTRLVRLFAHRFTVQERLGEEIADALVELMEPHGVAVHLQAVPPLHTDARRAGGIALDPHHLLAGRV